SAAGAPACFLLTALPPSTLPPSDSAPTAPSRMATFGEPSALAAASAALRSPSALAWLTLAVSGVPLIAGAFTGDTSLERPAVVGVAAGAAAAAGAVAGSTGASGAGGGT